MRPSIETSIAIPAPADAAWAVLSAFDEYPEWNPLVREVRGPVEPGAFIRVRLARPRGRGSITIRPMVTAASGGEFRWLGRFVSVRLLAGEHSFRVEPLGDDHARFVQAETYRGILSRLMVAIFGPLIRRSFEVMNRSFRDRVVYRHRRRQDPV